MKNLKNRSKNLKNTIEEERSKSGIRDVMMKNLENRNKNLEKTIENERSKITTLQRTIDRESGLKRKLDESTQTLRQSNELVLVPRIRMSTARNITTSYNTVASLHDPHEARKSELCLLSKLKETKECFSLGDLKSILSSLSSRLDHAKEQVHGTGYKCSSAQKLVKCMFTLCEKGVEEMERDDVVEAILDINNELAELESDLDRREDMDINSSHAIAAIETGNVTGNNTDMDTLPRRNPKRLRRADSLPQMHISDIFNLASCPPKTLPNCHNKLDLNNLC
eukprot:CAMPEP_0194097190 /NCGR_PEP_ID=MMETSP0149-20130528/57738_1 /TAXON_ID=122233 /ORGANISM="Chaetoceros debilis, Strain MM31A-1" /LENGTH=280 /DNA_ID=CAMNT_0038783203 /DNA_START=126 /DNA_END=968 /DNA_ORIENTATION=+